MKVISDCPRCGIDFMYDPNFDYHLVRNNMPPNTGNLGLNKDDLQEHDGTIIICQDCHEKETFVWNVNIITSENLLIHRRYTHPVTLLDVCDEYSKRGINIIHGEVKYGEPYDFFEYVRSKAKEHCKRYFNYEKINVLNVELDSFHIENQYMVSLIKVEAISLDKIEFHPSQLFMP